jgi:hypothetical protein
MDYRIQQRMQQATLTCYKYMIARLTEENVNNPSIIAQHYLNKLNFNLDWTVFNQAQELEEEWGDEWCAKVLSDTGFFDEI